MERLGSYLGCFAVGDMLWRGVLFHDAEGVYTASHRFSCPDGSEYVLEHPVAATSQRAAEAEALLSVIEYLDRHGRDPQFMTSIHDPTGQYTQAFGEVPRAMPAPEKWQ